MLNQATIQPEEVKVKFKKIAEANLRGGELAHKLDEYVARDAGHQSEQERAQGSRKLGDITVQSLGQLKSAGSRT